MNPLFFLFALIQAPVAKAPPALSAPEVVTKVQSYYASTQKLRADFRQQYTNATFGRSSESDGVVYVAKPGKMRWDYTRPEKKHFISDGTTLWVFEPAQNQALQQSLEDQILPVAVTFLYGKGDLATEFNATLDPGKYGGKEDLVVKLTPKKPDAQYKNLWLVVDPADFHVKESIILEASDNVNRFRFENVKQNDKAKVADKHFKFVPPAGVKVVKPEQSAQK
jgi:outer membrane lipoprotein carrier protein